MPFYDVAGGLQNPDILGAYIKGRMAPGAEQLQQQMIKGADLQNQTAEIGLESARAMQGMRQQLLGSIVGAQNQSAPNPGIQNGPQGAVAGGAVNGVPVNTMMALDIINGKDPLDTAKKGQEFQLTQRKLQAQPQLDMLKTVAGAPNADAIVMNNQSLIAAWPGIARQMGLDPVRDFNAQNVRMAATLAHNQLAGSVGLDAMPMPTQLQKVTDKSGYSYNVDPLTGKTSDIPGQITPYQRHEMESSDRRLALAERVSKGFDGPGGELLAALTEKGVSLPAGMRSKEQQLATVNGLLARNPDLTPDQIAEKVKNGDLTFAGERKEAMTAGGIVGKVKYAEQELLQSIPLALDASANVPRGKFVPLNKLLQTANTAISDPDLLDFKIKAQSVMNAYDMLAARGGTDVAKREEQHKLLSSAQSPEAFARALKAMEQEAKVAGSAGRAAMKPGGGEAEGQSSPQFKEGQTATNPKTGEKMVFRSGAWVKQ